MMFNDNLILESLTYIPTSEYNPMFARPYIVNSTQDAIDTLANRLDDTKSVRLNPSLINDVTFEIMQPSSVGFATLINNEWVSNKKYIFMLKAKLLTQTGEERIYYLQGYTNYNGITKTGNIDPDLVHTVNTVIETIRTTILTPLGPEHKESLYSIYNILTNGGYEEVYTQRPIDIIDSFDLIDITNKLSDPDVDSFLANAHLSDFDNKSLASNIDNNVASNYLSKILTSGALNKQEKSFMIGDIDGYEIKSNPSYIEERSIGDNRALFIISRAEGYNIAVNNFQFSTLLSIDPTIFDRAVVLNVNKSIMTPESFKTPEVGEYWDGQDLITVKAYSIIEASVSLATKLGFSKLSFTASNVLDPTGSSNVIIQNFISVMELDDRGFNVLLEMFKNKFLTEVFLPETNGGVIPTYIEMYVDLLGTSKVYLSIGGSQGTWYTIPTFANSLFSPVTTIDKNTLDITVRSFEDVIENLDIKVNHNNTANLFY